MSYRLVRCFVVFQFDFPFVQVFRVSRFKFRPLTSAEEMEEARDSSEVKIDGQQELHARTGPMSVWNCDGEVVDEPNVDYR